MYYMREFDPPLYIASGRTTRLVDKYIQDLFNCPGEWINIHDHAEWHVGRKATELLMSRIATRMLSEHGISIERKCGSFLRIPHECAQTLIRFREQQIEAHKQWQDLFKR